MGPRMSITSPCRMTHLGSLFRNFSAVILEPAERASGTLAQEGQQGLAEATWTCSAQPPSQPWGPAYLKYPPPCPRPCAFSAGPPRDPHLGRSPAHPLGRPDCAGRLPGRKEGPQKQGTQLLSSAALPPPICPKASRITQENHSSSLCYRLRLRLCKCPLLMLAEAIVLPADPPHTRSWSHKAMSVRTGQSPAPV